MAGRAGPNPIRRRGSAKRPCCLTGPWSFPFGARRGGLRPLARGPCGPCDTLSHELDGKAIHHTDRDAPLLAAQAAGTTVGALRYRNCTIPFIIYQYMLHFLAHENPTVFWIRDAPAPVFLVIESFPRKSCGTPGG